MNTEHVLLCRDVDMGYHRQVILPAVNLAVRRGHILGIVGPNGAGKTTLLKTLLGILPPVRGEITYPDGRRALRVGYVPQRQVVDETFPLTMEEVVMMGRYGRVPPGRRPGAADAEAAARVIDEVGMTPLRGRLYRELSGGQKQRALIARALTGDPTLLVLDEPTTDMDLASERAVMELIIRLQAAHHLTVLVVSHLLHVVLNLASFIALVDRRVAVFPIEEILLTDRLSAFYGVPVRIGQVGGIHVAL